MMSLTTYALVLVPCLVGAAAVLGVAAVRRSAGRLDRRAAQAAGEARSRARPRAVRRAVGR